MIKENSKAQDFMVMIVSGTCHYRDSEITEPKNLLPRTSLALLIKIHLIEVFLFIVLILSK